MLGLWNCRDFQIESILQFHEVLEGCRKFTRFKSDLVVQCVISKSSILYSSTLQGLNLTRNIELHLSHSSIPNSSAFKGNEPYWKHEEFNNDRMKLQKIYKEEKLVRTTI